MPDTNPQKDTRKVIRNATSLRKWVAGTGNTIANKDEIANKGLQSTVQSNVSSSWIMESPIANLTRGLDGIKAAWMSKITPASSEPTSAPMSTPMQSTLPTSTPSTWEVEWWEPTHWVAEDPNIVNDWGKAINKIDFWWRMGVAIRKAKEQQQTQSDITPTTSKIISPEDIATQKQQSLWKWMMDLMASVEWARGRWDKITFGMVREKFPEFNELSDADIVNLLSDAEVLSNQWYGWVRWALELASAYWLDAQVMFDDLDPQTKADYLRELSKATAEDTSNGWLDHVANLFINQRWSTKDQTTLSELWEDKTEWYMKWKVKLKDQMKAQLSDNWNLIAQYQQYLDEDYGELRKDYDNYWKQIDTDVTSDKWVTRNMLDLNRANLKWKDEEKKKEFQAAYDKLVNKQTKQQLIDEKNNIVIWAYNLASWMYSFFNGLLTVNTDDWFKVDSPSGKWLLSLWVWAISNTVKNVWEAAGVDWTETKRWSSNLAEQSDLWAIIDSWIQNSEEVASSVWNDYIVPNYWSLDWFANALLDDPVNTISDIVSVWELSTRLWAKLWIGWLWEKVPMLNGKVVEGKVRMINWKPTVNWQAVKLVTRGSLLADDIAKLDPATWIWWAYGKVLSTSLQVAWAVPMKTLKILWKWTSNLLDSFISKSTWLTKEQRQFIRENPDLVDAYLKGERTADDLIDEIKTKYWSEQAEKMIQWDIFNKLEQSNQPLFVEWLIAWWMKAFEKLWVTVQNWELVFSKTLEPSVRSKIEQAYKYLMDLKNKNTAADVHWAREWVGWLTKWDKTHTLTPQENMLNNAMQQLYWNIWSVLKQQVQWWADADAKYSSIKKVIDDFKDWFDKDGKLKDSAYSKIRNLTNANNKAKLERLLKYFPDMEKDLKALSASLALEKATHATAWQYLTALWAGSWAFALFDLLMWWWALTVSKAAMALFASSILTPANFAKLLKYEWIANKAVQWIADKLIAKMTLNSEEMKALEEYMDWHQMSLKDALKEMQEKGLLPTKEWDVKTKNLLKSKEQERAELWQDYKDKKISKEEFKRRKDALDYDIATLKTQNPWLEKTEREVSDAENVRLQKKWWKKARNLKFITELFTDMTKESEEAWTNVRWYTDLKKKLYVLSQNPTSTTAQHEFFHAVFSVIDDKTRKYVLDEAKKIMKEAWITDKNAEEWLAESFGIYAARKDLKLGILDKPATKMEKFKQAVRDLFQRAYEWMQNYNWDRKLINELFDTVYDDNIKLEKAGDKLDLSYLLNDKNPWWLKGKMGLWFKTVAEAAGKKASKMWDWLRFKQDVWWTINPNATNLSEVMWPDKSDPNKMVFNSFLSKEAEHAALKTVPKSLLTEDWKAPVWMHTNKYESEPFYEFKNVKDNRYKDSWAVVTFLTSNHKMSGSYADWKNKLAFTKQIKNMDDVKDFLKSAADTSNDYDIKDPKTWEWRWNKNRIDIVDKWDWKISTQQVTESEWYTPKSELLKYKDEYLDEYPMNATDKDIVDMICKKYNQRFWVDVKTEGWTEYKKFEVTKDWWIKRIEKKTSNWWTYNSKEEMVKEIKWEYDRPDHYSYAWYVQDVKNPLIVDWNWKNWDELWNPIEQFVGKEELEWLKKAYLNDIQDLWWDLYDIAQDLYDAQAKSYYNSDTWKLVEDVRTYFWEPDELRMLLDSDAYGSVLDDNVPWKFESFREMIERAANLAEEWFNEWDLSSIYGWPQRRFMDALEEYWIPQSMIEDWADEIESNYQFWWPWLFDVLIEESPLEYWRQMETNDWVRIAIEKWHDAVLFKNIKDYWWMSDFRNPWDVLALIQRDWKWWMFKAWDNKAPTENRDIRLKADIKPNAKSPNELISIWENDKEIFTSFISKEAEKAAYDVNPVMLSEDWRPYMWTSTNHSVFNPISDFRNMDEGKYTEFDNNEISWWSNYPKMSYSYADFESKLADTSKVKTIKDLKNIIKEPVLWKVVEQAPDWKNWTKRYVENNFSVEKDWWKYILKNHSSNVIEFDSVKDAINNNHWDANYVDTFLAWKSEKELRKILMDTDDGYDRIINITPEWKVKISDMWRERVVWTYNDKMELLAEWWFAVRPQDKYHYKWYVQKVKNPLVVDMWAYKPWEYNRWGIPEGKWHNWNDLWTAYDFMEKQSKWTVKKLSDKFKKIASEAKAKQDSILLDFSMEISRREKKLYSFMDEEWYKNNPEYKKLEREYYMLKRASREAWEYFMGRKFWLDDYWTQRWIDLEKDEVLNLKVWKFDTVWDLFNQVKEAVEQNKDYYDLIDFTKANKKERLGEWMLKNWADKWMVSLLHKMNWLDKVMWIDPWNMDLERAFREKDLQTNDYVFYALKKWWYDAVLFKGINDWWGGDVWSLLKEDHAWDVLALLHSNQAKAWDNANPTESKYIAYKKDTVWLNRKIKSPEEMAKMDSDNKDVVTAFISDAQRKAAYNVSPYLLNDEWNPYLWTSTNKHLSPIITDFRNVYDSKYKEFWDMWYEIAWATNNDIMSRSYADMKSELATTKSYKNVAEFNKSNYEESAPTLWETPIKDAKFTTEFSAKKWFKIEKEWDSYILKRMNEWEWRFKDKSINEILDQAEIAKEWFTWTVESWEEKMHKLSQAERIERLKYFLSRWARDWYFNVLDVKQVWKDVIINRWHNVIDWKFSTEAEAYSKFSDLSGVDWKLNKMYHYKWIITSMKNPLVVDLKNVPKYEWWPTEKRWWNDLWTPYDFLKKSNPEWLEKLKKEFDYMQWRINEFNDSYDRIINKWDFERLYNQAYVNDFQARDKLADMRNLKDIGEISEKEYAEASNKYYNWTKDIIKDYTLFRDLLQDAFEWKPVDESSIKAYTDKYLELKPIADEVKKSLDSYKDILDLYSEWKYTPSFKKIYSYLVGRWVNKWVASLLHERTWYIDPKKLDVETFLQNKSMQTNDYVFYALHQDWLYDWVVFKDIYDYGWDVQGKEYTAWDVVAMFNSKQFKNWNNTKPTESRYLSYKKDVIDSKWNKLTEWQQTFLKDTAIRNSDWVIVPVYHGTNSEYTVYDPKRLWSASWDYWFYWDWWYFATYKWEAKTYWSNIKEWYLNIKNPFYMDDLDYFNGKKYRSGYISVSNLANMSEDFANAEINWYTLREISDWVSDFMNNVKIQKLNDGEINWHEITYWKVTVWNKSNIETYSRYSDADDVVTEELSKHMRKNFTYVSLESVMQDITENSLYGWKKAFSNVLKELWHDWIVVWDSVDRADEIIAFESNQFKNMSNKNPTSNPDIRYKVWLKKKEAWKDESKWLKKKTSNYKMWPATRMAAKWLARKDRD